MEDQKTKIKEYEIGCPKREPKILPNYITINGVVERIKGNKFGEIEKLVRQYQ